MHFTSGGMSFPGSTTPRRSVNFGDGVRQSEGGESKNGGGTAYFSNSSAISNNMQRLEHQFFEPSHSLLTGNTVVQHPRYQECEILLSELLRSAETGQKVPKNSSHYYHFSFERRVKPSDLIYELQFILFRHGHGLRDGRYVLSAASEGIIKKLLEAIPALFESQTLRDFFEEKYGEQAEFELGLEEKFVEPRIEVLDRLREINIKARGRFTEPPFKDPGLLKRCVLEFYKEHFFVLS